MLRRSRPGATFLKAPDVVCPDGRDRHAAFRLIRWPLACAALLVAGPNGLAAARRGQGMAGLPGRTGASGPPPAALAPHRGALVQAGPSSRPCSMSWLEGRTGCAASTAHTSAARVYRLSHLVAGRSRRSSIVGGQPVARGRAGHSRSRPAQGQVRCRAGLPSLHGESTNPGLSWQTRSERPATSVVSVMLRRGPSGHEHLQGPPRCAAHRPEPVRRPGGFRSRPLA